MTVIEVYADISCPFTHFGLRRLVAAREERGAHAAIRVHAWPLEWVNGQPLDPAFVASEVAALREQVAPDLFERFDPESFPRTVIPAFGLAAAGYTRDDTTGEGVSIALRKALFEEGLDIADNDVIAKIAATFDIEPLDPDAAATAVRDDWERGKLRGVQGSPHFFAGDRDWFCPSLRIRHDDHGFDVAVARARMNEFYAVVLG
jgi:predicted DsbA family dithiol-disulfide isomerase